MRTPVVIDGEFLNAALKATGLETQREAVARRLRTLRRLKPRAGAPRQPARPHRGPDVTGMVTCGAPRPGAGDGPRRRG